MPGALTTGQALPTTLPTVDPTTLAERPDIAARLEADFAGFATLIEAGPGYGKTRLLGLWREIFERRGDVVVALDLDEELADAALFFQALRRACSKQLGISIAGPKWHGKRGTECFRHLAGLLRETAQHVTVILDGYDRVGNDILDQSVSDFTNAMATNVHLIIASRGKIRIPFGERRLDGGVAYLGQEGLRFTLDEIARFFSNSLSPGILARVSGWTEGWPIAVQFARSNLNDHDNDDEKVAIGLARAEAAFCEYVADEILRHLPPVTANLLIETSFLETFNGEIVEAVTGIQDAWGLLEALRLENLLTLDQRNGDRRYRCHSLLRRTLYAEFCRRGKRQITERHLAAANWFRLNDEPIAAITHAHAAGDAELVAALVLALDATMFGVSSGPAGLSAVMEHIPAEVFRHSPRLVLAQAYLAAVGGNVDTAVEIVRGVRAFVATDGPDVTDLLFVRDLAVTEAAISIFGGRGLGRADLVAVERIEANCQGNETVRGLINNLLGAIALNDSDFPEALSRCGSAVHFYSGQKSQNGLGYSHIHFGRLYAEMGETGKAIKHYSDSRQHHLLGSVSDDRSVGLASLFLAQTLYDRGDIDEALKLCSTVDQLAELGGYYYEGLYAGYRTLAKIKALTESVSLAMRHLNNGLAFARTKRISRLEHLLMLEKLLIEPDPAEFLLQAENVAAFIDQVAAAKEAGEREPWRIRDLCAMVSGRIALEKGNSTEALALLEAQSRECERQGRVRTQIDLLLRIALVYEGRKERERALTSLRRAVALAWSGGIVAPFFENGIDAIALLTLLATSNALKHAEPEEATFVNETLKLCSELGSKTASIFSPRERDVLRHLSRGLSNKLIARELDISPETVRFNLKAIYKKFGMTSGYANRRVVADFAATRGLV